MKAKGWLWILDQFVRHRRWRAYMREADGWCCVIRTPRRRREISDGGRGFETKDQAAYNALAAFKTAIGYPWRAVLWSLSERLRWRVDVTREGAEYIAVALTRCGKLRGVGVGKTIAQAEHELLSAIARGGPRRRRAVPDDGTPALLARCLPGDFIGWDRQRGAAPNLSLPTEEADHFDLDSVSFSSDVGTVPASHFVRLVLHLQGFDMATFDLNHVLALVQSVNDATVTEGFAAADYTLALEDRNRAQTELDRRTVDLSTAHAATSDAVKRTCEYLGQFGVVSAGSTSTGGSTGVGTPAE